eukprot:gnl/MRDRNA2_/MRDRNA2_17134_c0_seq1.p1 gnl/MRDRNA2_/MRDRNA2_17134_c0~~gnl/MRDRNA2_/MRDRNA2_17134_c0_seq1.p1  ORF type:complete len:198 (-),score=42.42 gnl/MRDRNA2_/MRDRNA2_17134_c0_seq1:37-561(-)
MASLLYGANRAVGTEIDAESLMAAARNADNNKLQVELYKVSDVEDATRSAGSYWELLRSWEDSNQSSLSSVLKDHEQALDDEIPSMPRSFFQPVSALDGQTFDLVVANILAPILIDIASELESRLAQGGRIALSGINKNQADTVVSTYQKLFDNVKVEKVEHAWVLITGNKRVV